MSVILVGAGTWGHRSDYVKKLSLFFRCSGYETLNLKTLKTYVNLLRRKHVLFFYTIDDTPKTFILISFVRVLAWRRTYGLILTPRAPSIISPRNLVWDFFNFFGRNAKRFGAISIVSGKGYDLHSPSAMNVVDPAFWPSQSVTSFGKEDNVIYSSLSRPKDRHPKLTMLSIGRIGHRKAHDFLFDVYSHSTSISSNLNLIIAGEPEAQVSMTLVQNLRSIALDFVDEYLDSSRMDELLRHSDLVWAYAFRGFDQSSGIAALGILNLKVPVVRNKSWIHSFLLENNLPHIALSESSTEASVQLDCITSHPEAFLSSFSPEVFRGALQTLGRLEISSKIRLREILES